MFCHQARSPRNIIFMTKIKLLGAPRGANIENWTTIRLIFHGHRGKRHGPRARVPSDGNDVAGNGGYTRGKA